jgi:hypothetical protein
MAAAGCQTVLALDDRQANPPPPPGCALPSVGGATLRVATWVPSSAHVDFCVRASGTSWARPVLLGSGTGAACTSGFSYPDVSAPFAVPLGKIDVKAIPAGTNCSGPQSVKPLSEIDGLQTNASAPVLVARIGGASGVPEKLVAYGSAVAPSSDDTDARVRFIHAAVGVKPLTFGVLDASSLPATLTQPVLGPLSFGQFPSGTPTLGKLNGAYLDIPGAPYNMGAATNSDPEGGVLVQSTGATTGATTGEAFFTLAAIGNDADPQYPVRGLYCLDKPSALAETDAGVDHLRSQCTQTALATLSFDIWQVGLYGAFAPEEVSRRQGIMDAITARACSPTSRSSTCSDVMCLTEIDRTADQNAAIAAGKAGNPLGGSFPYSVVASPSTDLNTQPNDPRDQSGATPPPPTTPPCGGTVPLQMVNDLYSCLIQNCNTTNDDTGVINGGGACFTNKCAAKILPLLIGTFQEQTCWDCVAANVVGYSTYAQNKLSCTTDTRPAFAFGGNAPSMVLSRFPIMKSETYVLPTTNWRRVVHYAQLLIDTNKTLDYYCAQLTPLLDQTMPYTGPYAPHGGSANTMGWEAEQQLDAQRVVDFVRAISGSNPAVIVGDWAASKAGPTMAGPGGVDAGGSAVVDLNAPTIAALQAAWGNEAVPSDFLNAPQCDTCADNPYDGAGQSYWNERPYATYSPNAVAVNILLKDLNAVHLMNGTYGPLAGYYLFNVQMLRP